MGSVEVDEATPHRWIDRVHDMSEWETRRSSTTRCMSAGPWRRLRYRINRSLPDLPRVDPCTEPDRDVGLQLLRSPGRTVVDALSLSLSLAFVGLGDTVHCGWNARTPLLSNAMLYRARATQMIDDRSVRGSRHSFVSTFA